MIDCLIVLAKQPRPGRVKTRLMPELSAREAAAVAAGALADTLEIARQTPAARHLLVFDGDPSGWVPPGWSVAAQAPGGLDERICAAFELAGRGPAMLVGMDTPQLRPAQLAAFDPTRYDCCLGPAEDGGYWTIGFRDPTRARAAVLGVAMSVPHTAAAQLHRLGELGLTVQLLDPLVDVDTFAAAQTVAALAPTTRFAAVLARLGAPTAVGAH